MPFLEQPALHDLGVDGQPDQITDVQCDGSVHPISYSIDALTHSRLGYRKDGQVLRADQF